MKKLIIADKEFDSRLFLGTGKFNSNEIMATQMKSWSKPFLLRARKW